MKYNKRLLEYRTSSRVKGYTIDDYVEEKFPDINTAYIKGLVYNSIFKSYRGREIEQWYKYGPYYTNDFIDFLVKLTKNKNVVINSKNYSLISYLYEHEYDKGDLRDFVPDGFDTEWLLNKSLYNDRTLREFEYTIKVLGIFDNLQALEKWFDKDVAEELNPKIFFDGNKIKSVSEIAKMVNELSSKYGINKKKKR